MPGHIGLQSLFLSTLPRCHLSFSSDCLHSYGMTSLPKVILLKRISIRPQNQTIFYRHKRRKKPNQSVGKPKIQVSLLYNGLPQEKVFKLVPVLWLMQCPVLSQTCSAFCKDSTLLSKVAKPDSNLQNPLCADPVSQDLAFPNSLITQF